MRAVISMTRRELAGLLGVHPDSISRNLAHGLGGAVLTWDERGRALTFDRLQAVRWWGAWRCPEKQAGGGLCRDYAFDAYPWTDLAATREPAS